MSNPLTIQLPPELEQQLTLRAAQLNIPLEAFVLRSLHQIFQTDNIDPNTDQDDEPCEYEDESKESILASLQIALQEVKDGKVRPIEELWDGIDD